VSSVALIIPPGFAQVLLPMKHALLAREAAITYGIDVSDAAGDFETAADAQVTTFIQTWGAELDSQVTVGPALLRVGQDGGDPLSVEGSTTGVGLESAAMLPPNVATLVKKRSSTGGRRGRGRTYIPWVTQEAAVDDVGRIDSTSLGVRQADATDWLTTLISGGGVDPSTPMVILHDSSGAGTEPAPSVVTALVVDAVVATQRRRLGR
jgi:hypothetical protein